MSKEEGAKQKLSFLETLRIAGGPYRRLYHYVKPYKWRFIFGLAFGFAFGAVNSLLPLVVAQVSSFIFQGAVPNPRTILQHREMLTVGPRINSIALICMAIPLVMVVRSL